MSVVSLSAAVGTNAFFKVSDVVMKALKFRRVGTVARMHYQSLMLCVIVPQRLGRHPESMEVGFHDNSSMIM